MQQLQQQQMQKQLLAQQLLMQQSGGMLGSASAPSKKQREVYIGNLAIGVITPELLREFFNKAFEHATPDGATNPAVVSINMDPSGRFGFVEFKSEEIATAAIAFDKVRACVYFA